MSSPVVVVRGGKSILRLGRIAKTEKNRNFLAPSAGGPYGTAIATELAIAIEHAAHQPQAQCSCERPGLDREYQVVLTPEKGSAFQIGPLVCTEEQPMFRHPLETYYFQSTFMEPGRPVRVQRDQDGMPHVLVEDIHALFGYTPAEIVPLVEPARWTRFGQLSMDALRNFARNAGDEDIGQFVAWFTKTIVPIHFPECAEDLASTAVLTDEEISGPVVQRHLARTASRALAELVELREEAASLRSRANVEDAKRDAKRPKPATA